MLARMAQRDSMSCPSSLYASKFDDVGLGVIEGQYVDGVHPEFAFAGTEPFAETVERRDQFEREGDRVAESNEVMSRALLPSSPC
jgi:hypothetical protein